MKMAAIERIRRVLGQELRGESGREGECNVHFRRKRLRESRVHYCIGLMTTIRD